MQRAGTAGIATSKILLQDLEVLARDHLVLKFQFNSFFVFVQVQNLAPHFLQHYDLLSSRVQLNPIVSHMP